MREQLRPNEYDYNVINTIRQTGSCLFLSLTILFLAWWIRSYFCCDYLVRESSVSHLDFYSLRGAVSIQLITYRGQFPRAASYQFRTLNDKVQSKPKYRGTLGFYYEIKQWGRNMKWRIFHIPFWFCLIVSAFLAVVARPKPRMRYSTRDFMLFTTFFTFAVGGVAIFVRSIGMPLRTPFFG